MQITHREFVRRYNDLIIGHEFVEYQDYYRNSINRFWKSFDRIQSLPRSENARLIDIGGGIMAVLVSDLLGINSCVGDVNRRGAIDVARHGIEFVEVNLLSDRSLPNDSFDIVVLQEVIEHLPQPPYIVLRRIAQFMKPDGILLLTSPNGSRLRNILYHLMGRRVLDNFRYPEDGEALGHQQEYTLAQLLWQLERARFQVLFSEQYDDGWAGATSTARLAHAVMKPANIFPHLRNGLVIAARPAVEGGSA